MRLFNADYDEYGFQPIAVSDGEGRPVAAMLRPARRPMDAEACAFLRRLVREIRGHWPRVEILIRADSRYCAPEVLDFCRADSRYCAPEVLDFCRAERLDFVLGVASTTTLRRHVAALEQSTAARHAAVPGSDKLRRYKEFFDDAGSWSRVERIVARVEAEAAGHRHTLRGHQPRWRHVTADLRGPVLREGTGREPRESLKALPGC